MDVYDEIKAERERQDQQWGGTEHDREHPPDEWVMLIKAYLDKAPTGSELAHTNYADEYRKRLIQVAALAVAAVEAWDCAQGAMSGESER